MTPISKSLRCAIIFLVVAIANRVGLVADKDAMVMFALIPALWIATGGLVRRPKCRPTA